MTGWCRHYIQNCTCSKIGGAQQCNKCTAVMRVYMSLVRPALGYCSLCVNVVLTCTAVATSVATAVVYAQLGMLQHVNHSAVCDMTC